MYYAYALKSEVSGKYYVGSTQNVDLRLNEHNHGKMRFTKGHIPWVLEYTESFHTRSEAFKRERYFKSGIGREKLKEILSSK